MRDVVIVGAGLAGLSAGWRLRHWDTVLLEADRRVAGRIESVRRGPCWLDWVSGAGFAGRVVEGKASRWQDGSPYVLPGRGNRQLAQSTPVTVPPPALPPASLPSNPHRPERTSS